MQEDNRSVLTRFCVNRGRTDQHNENISEDEPDQAFHNNAIFKNYQHQTGEEDD